MEAGKQVPYEEGPARPPSVVPDHMLPDFRQVFETSPRPLLLIAADPRLTMVAVNDAHAQAFGTTPEALCGFGVLEVFPPDPPPEVAGFVEAIRTSLARVIETARPDQMATRAYAVVGQDGRLAERFWSATNTPLLDANGVVTHILSAAQDVTGEVYERRSEQARRLLMREVDHRARNALTVVQSFLRLTDAETLEDFRRIVEGRVEALARAQTSLAARRWEGANLQHVVEAELGGLSATGRYTAAGPKILLGAEHVQPMSMAIHELATNASKYGGLSTEQGTLAVTWSLADGGCLVLDWAEAGGPAVCPPSREGFGSRLIRQLARQLGGEVAFDWRPEGLAARMNVSLLTNQDPLDEIEERRAAGEHAEGPLARPRPDGVQARA